MIELTRNIETKLWHPHLHVLYEGEFFPHVKLAADWLALTGDSKIVHITAINSVKSAAFYVTKYITKTADSSVYSDHEALCEAVLACKNRRLCIPFGTWRRLGLMHNPEEHDWTYVATLNELEVNPEVLPEGLAARILKAAAAVQRVEGEWIFRLDAAAQTQGPAP
jgi:hypothetical protein